MLAALTSDSQPIDAAEDDGGESVSIGMGGALAIGMPRSQPAAGATLGDAGARRMTIGE